MDGRKRPALEQPDDINVEEISNFAKQRDNRELHSLLDSLRATSQRANQEKRQLLKAYKSLKSKTSGYSEETIGRAESLVAQQEKNHVNALKLAIAQKESIEVIRYLIDVLKTRTTSGSNVVGMGGPLWYALLDAYHEKPERLDLIAMLLSFNCEPRAELFRRAVLDGRVSVIDCMITNVPGYHAGMLIDQLNFKQPPQSTQFCYALYQENEHQQTHFVTLFAYYMDALIVDQKFHEFLSHGCDYYERIKNNFEAAQSYITMLSNALLRLYAKDKVAYEKAVQHLWQAGFTEIVYIQMKMILMDNRCDDATMIRKQQEFRDFCLTIIKDSSNEAMRQAAADGLATALRTGAIIDDGNMGHVNKKSIIQAFYFCQLAGLQHDDLNMRECRYDIAHNNDIPAPLSEWKQEHKLYYLYFKSYMDHKLNPSPQNAETLELAKSLAVTGINKEAEAKQQSGPGLFKSPGRK